MPGDRIRTEQLRSDDAAVLRECVTSIVRDLAGPAASVIEVARRPHPGRGWYGAAILTVRLASGEERQLFWKDYGDERGPQPKPARQREREWRLYRDFLAQADLGTPQYYGSVWDEAAGRYWLFLELVSGQPLAAAEFPLWRDTARWLARLQAQFRERAPDHRLTDCLFRQTRDHFRSDADRAVDAAAGISRGLADQLQPVLDQYDRIAAAMLRGPPALVHREFHPDHVLVDTRGNTPRLCVIDWEHASLGSGLYDLAELTYQLPAPQVEQLLADYRDQLVRVRQPVVDSVAVRRSLAACTVHHSIKRIRKINRAAGRESSLGSLVARAVESMHQVLNS